MKKEEMTLQNFQNFQRPVLWSFGFWSFGKWLAIGTLLIIGTLLMALKGLVWGQAVQLNEDGKEEEIPGGIAYVSERRIVFYEFAKKQVSFLTADLEERFDENQPFALADDGRVLVWLRENGFWGRVLPNGKPYPLPLLKPIERNRVIPWPITNIKNLKVCSQGTQIAYETLMAGDSWTRVSRDDKRWRKGITPEYEQELQRILQAAAYQKYYPGRRGTNMQSPVGKETRISLPRQPRRYLSYSEILTIPCYIRTFEIFNGVVSAHADAAQHPGTDVTLYTRFGNSALPFPEMPFVTLTAMAWSDFRVPTNTGIRYDREVLVYTDGYYANYDCNYENLILKFRQDQIERWFSLKRNARFPCWNKNKEFLAVIYETQNGWGPIEIRNLDYGSAGVPPDANAPKKQPERWKAPILEIPINLKTCESLAWKPDGSLTYLSEGRLFLFKEDEIRQGIEKSSLKIRVGVNVNDAATSKDEILSIKSIPIDGERIEGTQIFWLTDDIFVFKGLDNTLYLWKNNRREKIPASLPENFSICSFSPLARKGRITLHSGSLYNVGTIRFKLEGIGRFDTLAEERSGEKQKEREGRYVKTQETNFENIKDPLQYADKFIDPRLPKRSWPNLGIGQILLLKKDNEYAAVKAAAFEKKSLWDLGVFGNYGFQFFTEGATCVTLEWQYWPGEPEKTKITSAEEAGAEKPDAKDSKAKRRGPIQIQRLRR